MPPPRETRNTARALRIRRPSPSLRTRLEEILDRYPPALRIRSDPVIFPRRRLLDGAQRQDVESVALLSAMLAYGRVSLFMPVLEKILDGCPPPYPSGFLHPGPSFSWPGYRFSTGPDIQRFTCAVAHMRKAEGGAWEAFARGWQNHGTVWAGAASLRNAILDADAREAPPTPGLLHLLPDPAAGGCAKRWMLFLRWMARPDDGVDLGLWPSLPAHRLVIPLDRHIGLFARRFGWTSRRTDDQRTAEEITSALRRFRPDDPLRYDFALSHLGIDGACLHGRDPAACRACSFHRDCFVTGAQRRISPSIE